MKKFMAALLTLAMLLTLCACGSKPADNTPQDTTPSAADNTPADTAEPAADPTTPPAGYPAKSTVSYIVPSSAGGSIDTISRMLLEYVEIPGADIVVEDISGGSQSVATAEMVTRDDGGNTVIVMCNSGYFVQPLLNDLIYTPDDILPFTKFFPDVTAIVTFSKNASVQTIEEMFDYFKTTSFTYGVTNWGAYAHQAMGNLLNELGCPENGTCIVYEGSQNLYQAVINGELDCAVMDDSYIVQQVNNGEVNGLLSLSANPSPVLPEIPTASEYGIANAGSFVGFKFLAVHKNTPPEVVAYLKNVFDEAIMSEGYQKYLADSNAGTLDHVSTLEEIRAEADAAAENTRNILISLGMITE